MTSVPSITPNLSASAGSPLTSRSPLPVGGVACVLRDLPSVVMEGRGERYCCCLVLWSLLCCCLVLCSGD